MRLQEHVKHSISKSTANGFWGRKCAQDAFARSVFLQQTLHTSHIHACRFLSKTTFSAAQCWCRCIAQGLWCCACFHILLYCPISFSIVWTIHFQACTSSSAFFKEIYKKNNFYFVYSYFKNFTWCMDGYSSLILLLSVVVTYLISV